MTLPQWRRIAVAALSKFGLTDASLSLIKCGENVTYRVSRPGKGLLLLRLHRPIYHAPEEVGSELAWLEALHRSGALPVPRPAAPPAIVEGHVCSLLHWVPGRQRFKALQGDHMRALGRTTALLHGHALSWRPPAGFTRLSLDWDGLLSRNGNWGRLDFEVTDLFAEPDRSAVRGALAAIRAAMKRLDGIPESRALIHADLHMGNVVFSSGLACPIDFDDSGFGYLAYDLATSLIPYRESPRYPALRDALLEGYSEVRALEREQVDALPEFLAARGLTMALWLQSRKSFIRRLPADLTPYLSRTASLCREVC